MAGLVGRKRLDPRTLIGQGDTSHKGKAPQYSRAVAEGPPGVPEMPVRLSKAAKLIWIEITPMLAQMEDLLSLVDGAVIGNYCEVRAQKIEIEAAMYDAALAAERLALKGAKKIARTDVLIRYQNCLDKLRMRETALQRELGLTPAARSSLKVGPLKTVKSQAADAMDDVFMGGSMRPV